MFWCKQITADAKRVYGTYAFDHELIATIMNTITRPMKNFDTVRYRMALRMCLQIFEHTPRVPMPDHVN